MHRRAWTWAAVAGLVVGVGLFLSGPHETSFVMASGDPHLPSSIYWLPPYRLLGIAIFVGGFVVLTATTAYAAGLRKGRSAAD